MNLGEELMAGSPGLWLAPGSALRPGLKLNGAMEVESDSAGIAKRLIGSRVRSR